MPGFIQQFPCDRHPNRTVWAYSADEAAEICRNLPTPEDPDPVLPDPDPQDPTNPETATPITGGPGAQAPGGPGKNRGWAEWFLDLIGLSNEPETDPQAPLSARPSAACCGPESTKPDCLRCWLKAHRGWLLLLLLAIAAYYVTKKR